MHDVHHLAADVDQLYALCTKSGQGLQLIESTYQSCIVGLDCYLRSSSDHFMQMIQKCDTGRSSHSIQRIARLSKDNKLQSLHGSGTIMSGGVFKQASQTDAKISAHAAVLFVYGPRAQNLCTVSIAVSLKNHL